MRPLALTIAMLLAAAVSTVRGSSAVPATAAVDFTTIEIFVDSADRPLAAYQFDFSSRTPGVKIVGLEGGEHPAFNAPPYYDPHAMMGDRVIAAAFSTEPPTKLPVGKTRVATLHLELPAGSKPYYEVTLTAAATSDGSKLPATITFVKGSNP